MLSARLTVRRERISLNLSTLHMMHGGNMRHLFYLCLILGMTAAIIAGCSGSSTPLIPDSNSDDQNKSTSDYVLTGVEIQNNVLASLKLANTELLPWAFRDIVLDSDGTYPLEIALAEPVDSIVLQITGGVLRIDGVPVDSYSGTSMKAFTLTDIQPRLKIHLSAGGHSRDIEIRTYENDDRPNPANSGIELMIDPESGSRFDIATRELLVGTVPGTEPGDFEILASALDSEILMSIPKIDVYRVRIPSNDYNRYIREYESSPIVRYAEFNAILYTCIVPDDTFEDQEYGNDLMQLYDAWDITTGTSDVILSIVDSGVMRDHPDLVDNIIDGEDFIDPPGDGLGGATPGDGVDNNNDGVPDNNVEHGTHCAGITAAVGNNSEGVSGHSWNAKILSCRVFPVDGDSGAMDSDVADAIIWAADQGAAAISMSLGSYYGSGTEQAAINYAWDEGSVIVAAAGNSNTSTPHYPSSFPHVVSVAATDSNDKKASFSNYGDSVDVSAPGYQIPSSIFYEHSGNPNSIPENQRYALYSGTSMACPQVTGLVGLVASWYPAYTNTEIVDQIVFTTDNIDALNPGYVGALGTGRINDYRALTVPLAPDFEIIKMSAEDDHPLYSQGNRDGFLNPGEIIEFQPILKNSGTKAAPDCTVTLIEENGNLQILHDSVYLGYVYQGTPFSPDEPLVFRVNPAITEDTMADVTLRFDYYEPDPIELDFQLEIRTDNGIVDTITVTGENMFEEDLAKGMFDVPALSLTIEGDLDYGTLDELVIHQTGTASPSSFTDVQLWLDADENGYFSPLLDTRIAYRSYDHEGYRGNFDDMNDPETGFNAGIDYEEFPPVYFNDDGNATFLECVLPTAPGVPRTVFVVIGITAEAQTGETVQISLLSSDDVIVLPPDQVDPLGFPIQTEEVPIVGRWLDPERLTETEQGGGDPRYSWRAECAVCPVTGNVYVVFDSNRGNSFDVFFRRSVDQAASFEDAIKLDTSGANEFYPDIQVDSAGTVHVVYYSTKISNNNREIYYTRSYDYGETWDAPVRLTDATNDSRIPKLAIGPGDSLHMAWHDDRTSNDDYNVYYKKSDNGGNTWSDDIMVADTSTASEEVAIAVGGDGVIHIIWEELSGWYYGNVYYARSINNGISFEAHQKLSTGSYNNHCWHSDIAADDLGNVHAVYHYVPLTIQAEVVSRTSNNSGETFNGTFNLTNNTVMDSRPAIHAMADGSYVDIVIRRNEAGNMNTFHMYSEDHLETWSDPVPISNSTGGDCREAVIVRSYNLNIFAFWEDLVTMGGAYDIFWNRYLY